MFLAALTLVTFLPSHDHEFLDFDDQDYVTANSHVQAGLTAESTRWALTATHAANWHPLTWWSLQLDYELHGLSAAGFRVTNILLHAAAAILLFLALQTMTGTTWPSLIAAAIFAVHPQRVESVVWIAERKDVLSGLFWMLTLFAYAWYAKAPSWIRYAAVIAAMTLGLMAKPMLVTLPFVLLLLDRWPLQRLTWSNVGRRVLEKLPLLALAAASSVVTIVAQQEAIQPVERISFGMRLANALYVYVAYLQQLLWPAGLVAYYHHSFVGLLSMKAIVAGVVLAGLSAFAVAQARRRPYLLVGWLWYLGTLVPVIGLVQVGGQAMADRYTYIPTVGIVVAIVWALAELAARKPEEKLIPLLAVMGVLGILTYCTWQQSAHWKNTESLWQHAVDVDPTNYPARRLLAGQFLQQARPEEALEQYRLALPHSHYPEVIHNDIGRVFMSTGQFDEAVKAFRRSLQHQPNDATVHNNLGTCLVLQKKYAEAEPHLTKALEAFQDDAVLRFNLAVACAGQRRLPEARSHFAAGLVLEPDNADAHETFGAVLRATGEHAEALPHLETAHRLQPKNADVLHELGLTLMGLGEPREALARLQQALQIAPKSVAILRSLGHAHFANGDAEAGQRHYEEATRLHPGWTKSVQQEAWNLATNPDEAVRNGREAVRLAEQICQATRFSSAALLDTLAAAHAEAGRFDEAVKYARQALDWIEMRSESKLAREIAARIELYGARKAYRAVNPR